MASEYLYFPSCKIMRADYIPQNSGHKCSLHLKSTHNTPAHYPKSPYLAGKAEFFFGLQASKVTWGLLYEDRYQQIFGNKDISLIHKHIKKKLSVIVRFDETEATKLFVFGIGLENEAPLLFNNDLSFEENESIVKYAVLASKLEKKTAGKAKKQKI